MAIAEEIYADPSALLKLYLKEPASRAVAAWRAQIGSPLCVTHHGRIELVNGIGLALYRKLITQATRDAALAALDDDFAQGRYAHADMLWRATLKRADELSRLYTSSLGCRTLDIIHVASALELQLPYFVSFDLRQQKLAQAVSLKLIVPA